MFIYSITHLQLNNSTNQYVKYHDAFRTSQKKAEAYVQNVIEVNKGFDATDKYYTDNRPLNVITDYTCYSVEGKLMKMRLVLERKEVL